MEKTKIGMLEAIALILTIIATHTILSMPKEIVSSTKSGAIINIVFISFIAILLAYFIFRLFKKFPGLDIIDISDFLGGKIFKTIIGSCFIIYFLLTSSILLRNFSYSLQTIYYPMTDLIFILVLFILAIAVVCSLDLSAVIKTNLLIVPAVFLSIVFLFFANTKNFTLERIFPILGDGASSIFLTGASNLFAFGGIVFLYFLPPLLKEPKEFKKICISAISISSIYLLLSVSAILFMFNSFIETNELMPLYTAVRYIEFGTFFQRLDSIFLLIWIISFCCYTSIILKFSMNIFKKLTNIKNTKIIVYPFVLLVLGIMLMPKNFAISTFFENTVYKYAFFILVIGISLSILIFANLKKKSR